MTGNNTNPNTSPEPRERLSEMKNTPEQRLLVDVEREVRAACSSRDEYVGRGMLEVIYVRPPNTGPLKRPSLRYRFKGKPIPREMAANLVQEWNGPSRSPGFYWLRAGDDWSVGQWNGVGWLLIENPGGPYTDAECCDEVGERILRAAISKAEGSDQ